jgi:hypothetical protein
MEDEGSVLGHGTDQLGSLFVEKRDMQHSEGETFDCIIGNQIY